MKDVCSAQNNDNHDRDLVSAVYQTSCSVLQTHHPFHSDQRLEERKALFDGDMVFHLWFFTVLQEGSSCEWLLLSELNERLKDVNCKENEGI